MNRPVTHELRVEVDPPWPFRLRGGSADGLLRRRGALAAAAAAPRRRSRSTSPSSSPRPTGSIFGARADSETDAMWGIRRLRFATGVDDDLRPFYDAFRDDPVIGRARAGRAGAPRRGASPLPWEALAAAVTEQLIEFERAVAIQRRLIAALGRALPATPACATPRRPRRSRRPRPRGSRRWTSRRRARSRCAARPPRWRPAASTCSPPIRCPAGGGCARSRAIGPWTLEMLACYGQGHHDRVAGGRPRLPQARRPR